MSNIGDSATTPQTQSTTTSSAKWVLTHGIHRGTVTSRDSCNPESFDTEADALQALGRHRKFYRSIGYVIWFAYLEAPDGTRRSLGSNVEYS